MVNVGSLPVMGDQLFDLDTSAGVTAVLLAVRASGLSSAEKNELRDLVFLYTNGGKDQPARRALEQKIAAYQLVPVSAPAVSKSAASSAAEARPAQPPIGSARNAPSFTPPVVPVVTATTIARVPVTQPEPTIVSTPTPTPAAVSIPTPEVEIPSLAQSAPVAEAVPVSDDPEPVAVPPIQMPKPDQQQYLERIREIKSRVNEKVGNPVNLVDINNDVGREYMSALLDAMKRINSGQSADAAMQRLEAAYALVEETLRQAALGGAEAPAKEPLPTPVFESVEPAPVAPVSSFNSAPAVTMASRPIPEPMTPPVQYEPVVPAAPVSSYTAPVPVSIPVAPLQYEPVAAQQPVVPTPNYTTAQTAAPVAPTVHAATPHTFSSLADMVQQSNAQVGLPTTPAAAAPLASGDVLLAAEVESGLDQLLSEWTIFKKSGIFGTGPKGREHPLYKKMAELQIPLLLAGRFEGATEEVRQSLTDYMNGWRYEQGLIYERGETFEHYLRRVIRHILDQQQR